jgi:phosphoribosylformimino-5-aminoimidazole carboxamide ribotide isomerase
MSNHPSPFAIYPAIDLHHGKVVRLFQGDLKHETLYGENPAGTAQHWLEQGAQWLHVINLDGAFGQPDQINKAALEEILNVAFRWKPPARVQFGGGLRSIKDCQAALDTGVARIILGTLAVEKPAILRQALETWGAERVCLAIDAREGQVQVRGWLQNSAVSAIELASRFIEMGGRILIHTDIARDGSGQGLNLEASQELARLLKNFQQQRFPGEPAISLIASGGLATLSDIQAVKAAGLSGVIIGRALYQGAIMLKDALAC